MKKQSNIVLCAICASFFVLTASVFFLRNLPSRDIHVEKLPLSVQTQNEDTHDSQLPLTNINTADQLQLQQLPGVGAVLAQRIIDYRTANGAFTRLEELLNVEGIGDGKLEALLPHITIGGAS